MPTISFNNSEFYSQPRISDDPFNPKKYIILTPNIGVEASIVFIFDDTYYKNDGINFGNGYDQHGLPFNTNINFFEGLSSKGNDEILSAGGGGVSTFWPSSFFDIPYLSKTIGEGFLIEQSIYREAYVYDTGKPQPNGYYEEVLPFNTLTGNAVPVQGTYVLPLEVFDSYEFYQNIRFGILNQQNPDGSYIDNIAHFGNTNDMVGAYDGDDQIFTYGGDDTAYGGAGNDTIISSTGRNNLFGGDGNDTLKDGSGNGFLFGENGDDYLYGGPNTDVLLGGFGDDDMLGGSGHDILYDTYGDNLFKGQDGDDIMIAGAGNDRMYGGNGNDSAYGHLGDDYIDGGKGNDVLVGGFDSDEIKGRQGNDILVADYLKKIITPDIYEHMLDDLYYQQAIDDIPYAYSTGIFSDELDQQSTLDQLFTGNDKLRGGDGDDVLFSGNGRDLLYGEGDNDLLIAMAEGQAIMSGGEGADQFAFRGTPMFKAHTIKDFDITEDTLNLSDILDGFDAAVDQIDDFVKLFFRDSGRTDIKVSVEGTGHNWEALTIVEADLEHYTASDLLGQGTLITDDPLFSGSEWL